MGKIIFQICLMLVGALLLTVICASTSSGDYDFPTAYFVAMGFIVGGFAVYKVIYTIRKIIYPNIEIGDWVEVDPDPIVLDSVEFSDRSAVYKVEFISSNDIAHIKNPETGKVLFLRTFRLSKLPDIKAGTWIYNSKFGEFAKIILIEEGFMEVITSKKIPFNYYKSDYESIRPASFNELFDNDLR